MRPGIRTIDLIALSLLTLVVVATTSAVQLVRLSRVTVDTAYGQTQTFALELVDIVRHLLHGPNPGSPVERLRHNATLEALMDAHASHSPQVVYAMIVATDGEVLARSLLAPLEAVGQARPSLERLARAGAWERLRTLYQPGSLYEVVVPLEADQVRFASLQLVVDTSLVRQQIVDAVHDNLRVAAAAILLSWLFALGVSHLMRSPVRRLGQQIDRLRRGELDVGADAGLNHEFNELSVKLRQLGQEMQASKQGLLAQKATLERVIDRINYATILLDHSGRIVFCNSPCSELIGTELPVGLELSELLPESHPICRLLQRVQQEGRNVQSVRCELPTDAKFRDSTVSIFAMPGDKGPAGHVILIEDLSSLESLHSLVDYATRVSTMGKVASGVVHEVKNPLNVMTLQIDLLRSQIGDVLPGGVPQEIDRSLNRLTVAMSNLDRVVRGSLDYLRPRPLNIVALDIGVMLSRIADFFAPEAEGRGIALHVQRVSGAILARADEGALWQVLTNLVVNAFDGTPKGGEVRLNATRSGDTAVITVSDTGVGIRSEQIRDVFKFYYTTKKGGSGMGLSIVQRLMTDQGGTVELASEPGKGTTVTVRLQLLGRAGSAVGLSPSGVAESRLL